MYSTDFDQLHVPFYGDKKRFEAWHVKVTIENGQTKIEKIQKEKEKQIALTDAIADVLNRGAISPNNDHPVYYFRVEE